jgi:hypothetical protein
VCVDLCPYGYVHKRAFTYINEIWIFVWTYRYIHCTTVFDPLLEKLIPTSQKYACIHIYRYICTYICIYTWIYIYICIYRYAYLFLHYIYRYIHCTTVTDPLLEKLIPASQKYLHQLQTGNIHIDTYIHWFMFIYL